MLHFYFDRQFKIGIILLWEMQSAMLCSAIQNTVWIRVESGDLVLGNRF